MSDISEFDAFFEQNERFVLLKLGIMQMRNPMFLKGNL
jgi:hypothetical protein